VNLENAGTDTVPGIPSLPLATGLLILALIKIGLKNKNRRKKYYSMFNFLFSFATFSTSNHTYWNSAGGRTESPQNTPNNLRS